MRSSHIVAVDPTALVDAQESGWAYLGTVDGVAYCTVGRYDEPRYFLDGVVADGQLVGQELSAAEAAEAVAAGATVMVWGERPPLPWGEDYTLVFDPSPEPFRWDDFAAAHPDLAAPLDSDEPGPLRPLVWAGE
jgi:hypothetical protein